MEIIVSVKAPTISTINPDCKTKTQLFDKGVVQPRLFTVRVFYLPTICTKESVKTMLNVF